MAIGFGQTEFEAAAAAAGSLKDGFEKAQQHYVANWQAWQQKLVPLDRQEQAGVNAYRVSTAVLASHRAADRAGAVVASLSIPWGFSKGDDDLGGYHLVWPRDLVETAGGFLAAGDTEEAIAILDYLRHVQQPSGRWPQNLWLDGKPYWPGIQMDECAFPILLTDMLRRLGHLDGKAQKRFMPMVRNAANYILTNGPTTCEDRWEEDAGYSPFTLAVEIAALLAAADLLSLDGDDVAANHLRETADCWNEQIEQWTFAGEKNFCEALGISGHYVRIAPLGTTDEASASGNTEIRNQTPDRALLPTADVLSPDALALVRFGLRAPDDPHILDTIQAIDHSLRADLPQGSLWYRYTGDGYGEHEDGAPSMVRARAGLGRYWLANARITNLLQAGVKPPKRFWERSRNRRAMAAFSRNRFGMDRICREGALSRSPVGQCHATRLGPFRAYQASAIAEGWRRVRYAAAGRRALHQEQDRVSVAHLAFQQPPVIDPRWQDASTGNRDERGGALERGRLGQHFRYANGTIGTWHLLRRPACPA